MERKKQKEKQILLIQFRIDDRINGGLTNGNRKTIHDFVKGNTMAFASWILRQLKRYHKKPYKKGVGEWPNLSFE